MRGGGGFKHFLFLFAICVLFSLIFSDRKYVIVFPTLHFLRVKNEGLSNGTTELHNWIILVHNVQYLWTFIWSSVHNLRGGIQRAAAECLKKLVLVVKVGQTKICNLESKTESEQANFVSNKSLEENYNIP